MYSKVIDDDNEPLSHLLKKDLTYPHKMEKVKFILIFLFISTIDVIRPKLQVRYL